MLTVGWPQSQFDLLARPHERKRMDIGAAPGGTRALTQSRAAHRPPW
jgi:hypothetical protein